jgi:hypothetical protein
LGTRLFPQEEDREGDEEGEEQKGQENPLPGHAQGQEGLQLRVLGHAGKEEQEGEEVRHRGPPHQGLGGAVEEVEEEGVGVGPLGHQGGQDLVDRPRQEEEDDGRKPSQEEGKGLAQEVAVQGLHRSLQVR